MAVTHIGCSLTWVDWVLISDQYRALSTASQVSTNRKYREQMCEQMWFNAPKLTTRSSCRSMWELVNYINNNGFLLYRRLSIRLMAQCTSSIGILFILIGLAIILPGGHSAPKRKHPHGGKVKINRHDSCNRYFVTEWRPSRLRAGSKFAVKIQVKKTWAFVIKALFYSIRNNNNLIMVLCTWMRFLQS